MWGETEGEGGGTKVTEYRRGRGTHLRRRQLGHLPPGASGRGARRFPGTGSAAGAPPAALGGCIRSGRTALPSPALSGRQQTGRESGSVPAIN